jgi:hypothetical protein
MRVPRLLALSQHHDIEFTRGGGDFFELRNGEIERGLSGLIGRVVFEKLSHQAPPICLTSGELLKRRGCQLTHRRSRLIGSEEPEFGNVGIAKGGAVTQFKDELFISLQHERLGQGIERGVDLFFRKALGRPSIPRVIIERAFDIAILTRFPLDLGIGNGGAHRDVADLRAALSPHLNLDVGEDELATLAARERPAFRDHLQLQAGEARQ